MNAIQRIKKYIDYKKITNREFEKNVGFSNGAFSSRLKKNGTIGVNKLESILSFYSDLDPTWVLTGEGEMIRESPLGTIRNYEEEIQTLKAIIEDKEKIIALQDYKIKTYEQKDKVRTTQK